MTEAAVILVCATGACLTTAGGVEAVRRYALAREILDHPNERSSHSAPVPRGGGIAVVFVVLAAMVIGWGTGSVDDRTFIAFGPSGIVVAAVGWIDDRWGLSAVKRLVVHALAAAWMVGALGGVDVIRFGDSAWRLGWIGSALAVVGVVWFVNLYNFMDGIDGLAGVEAAVGGIGIATVSLAMGDRAGATTALLIASSSVGFLFLNWPPARIFLGDVGSGTLGLWFGGLAVRGEALAKAPGWLVVFILGGFVTDATVTLARRAGRGELWYEAHRSHAYQRLAQAGVRHRTVTIAIGGVTLLLSALGLYAALVPASAAPVAALGIVLLLALYLAVDRLHPM